MTDNQAIFESLFNRNFSAPDNVDFLNEITARHPYFSPAQFFLLQKTTGNDGFEKQVLKTNILFNNPHWLNFQLQQTSNTEPKELIEPADTNTRRQEPVNEIIMPVEINDEILEPVEEINAEIAMDTINQETEMVMDTPDETDATDETAMEPEIEPMKIELKMPEEKANLDEAMLFEPMHMVDYFASQGIKLTDEVQMADKLGKQLKSFTEWLKTMKKIHVENEVDAAPETNTSIQILAENSNADAKVLTEAMAEVFSKQGKPGKAVEVYQKLSLLNPAKSAYFAAKIENLKGI